MASPSEEQIVSMQGEIQFQSFIQSSIIRTMTEYYLKSITLRSSFSYLHNFLPASRCDVYRLNRIARFFTCGRLWRFARLYVAVMYN